MEFLYNSDIGSYMDDYYRDISVISRDKARKKDEKKKFVSKKIYIFVVA